MEWISVEKELPPNNETVLTLIEGYFPNKDDPLSQRTSNKIFEGRFFRSFGWEVDFLPNKGHVRFWMPLPEGPNAVD